MIAFRPFFGPAPGMPVAITVHVASSCSNSRSFSRSPELKVSKKCLASLLSAVLGLGHGFLL